MYIIQDDYRFHGLYVRIQVFYEDLEEILQNTTLPIMGTYLQSEDVHTLDFPKSGYLIIGNESHGIQENITKYITKKITIPRRGKAESLNAGIATAIVLDNIFQNI